MMMRSRRASRRMKQEAMTTCAVPASAALAATVRHPPNPRKLRKPSLRKPYKTSQQQISLRKPCKTSQQQISLLEPCKTSQQQLRKPSNPSQCKQVRSGITQTCQIPGWL